MKGRCCATFFSEGLNAYTAKENTYMIIAIRITTKRFGPSGSLKNKNIDREHITAVMLKMSSEILLDLKYIAVSIFEIGTHLPK